MWREKRGRGSGRGVDNVGETALIIFPEIELAILLKQIGWQHGLAGPEGDLALHFVEALDADAGVEFRLLVVQIFVIVRELRLAEKSVNQRDDLSRRLGKQIVIDDEDIARLRAIKRLLQRVVGKPHKTVPTGERLDPVIDGVALGRIVEEAGRLEGVFADEALYTVHDPCHIADRTDDFGVREQLKQQRQPRAPQSVGIDDDVLGVIFVIQLKQSAEHPGALFLVDEIGVLVALPHRVVQRRKQRADGTRHRRMNAGILPQDRREQRGAAARQPGYKMVANKKRDG